MTVEERLAEIRSIRELVGRSGDESRIEDIGSFGTQLVTIVQQDDLQDLEGLSIAAPNSMISCKWMQ